MKSNSPSSPRSIRPLIGASGILIGIVLTALYAGARSRPTGIAQAKEGETIQISVDVTKPTHTISPEIYGMAQSPPAYSTDLRLPLRRWGGNPATRYNWEHGNYWNAARDWEYRNGNYGNNSPEARQPSGVPDGEIAAANRTGTATYLTIPTMGWVARNDDNNTRSTGVPDRGGNRIAPGSEAVPGYDPTENRRRVSVKSLPRKGKPFSDPPDLTDNYVYQDEWVAHLVKKFGKASSGGVRYYAMDNEPDLWDFTHADMHPISPSYDDLFKQFTDYASAIKDVDPTAKIGGPVSWGWTGFFYSPKDRSNDNFAAHADRKSHGDTPFLPWFLKKAADYDKIHGRRTLDICDIHYYPQTQGTYMSPANDANATALRLRSTRSLWDPDYKDESWINEKVQLIPRLKSWVKANYPGTKIGIMEWSWGADGTLNGGLTIGEILGVFGREGLDMAAYWTCPPAESPGYFAYKMYRNADGKGNGFGDKALSVKTNAVSDRVSCFAALDSKTGEPTLMLLNKRPDKAERVKISLAGLTGANLSRNVHLFRYSGANLKNLVALPDITMSGGTISLTLSAYSMTLIR